MTRLDYIRMSEDNKLRVHEIQGLLGEKDLPNELENIHVRGDIPLLHLPVNQVSTQVEEELNDQ